jgi:hypothetical protein
VPSACVVPGLHRMTLSQARRALDRAHCRLGEVRQPKRVSRRHALHVVSQAARRGTRHATLYRVGITLR